MTAGPREFFDGDLEADRTDAPAFTFDKALEPGARQDSDKTAEQALTTGHPSIARPGGVDS